MTTFTSEIHSYFYSNKFKETKMGRFLIKPRTDRSHVREENVHIAANSLAIKENKKLFLLPGRKRFFSSSGLWSVNN